MTAMNYNEPQTETYTFPNLAFGNNTATFNLIGPKGRRGLVKDIIVDISLGMVGTSSVPEIDVGTTSGDVSYAQYRLGTSPILGYTSTSTPKRATQEAITGNPPPALNDFPGHVALEKSPMSLSRINTRTIIMARPDADGSTPRLSSE